MKVISVDSNNCGHAGFERFVRATPFLAALGFVLACLPLFAAETAMASASAQDQGRQHPSYQVFAANMALPPIYAPDKSTIVIDGKEINVHDPAVDEVKSAAADHLGVPIPVLNKALQQASGNPDTAQMAQQLRTDVLDYKYLLSRWTLYHPPVGSEELRIKTKALQSLQAGEIAAAWEMYMALPRPQAPTGFHVANGS